MGRGDLQGLTRGPVVDGDCGPEVLSPVGRYIGGAGHELGHTFGLSHPPGCDAGATTCDGPALMWSGYGTYPNTYLRTDDKSILRASAYFGATIQTVWDGDGRPGETRVR